MPASLRARLYTPPGDPGDERPSPLLVYFHGGGWVVGDIETHDQPCRLLALHSGAKVLSVDYRLAPEHPFPAAVEDALASFRDAIAKAGALGIDPARVAVAGDSAGGHLAAVCSILAAADGGPAPAFQLLIYPATDFVETSASRVKFGEGFLLTKENMDWYEEQFLGSGVDRRDPRVSPLHASSLEGVAPAMIVTAGFDPLRDEGEAYARRLRQAGVRCTLRRHPGSVHGFIHVLIAGTTAREALAEMGGALRGALASGAAPALQRAGIGAAPGDLLAAPDVGLAAMRVYHRKHTGRPLRIIWTLEEVGEPYELIVMDDEESKSAAHLARHPLGRVPVLEDEEELLFESTAMCMQIGDRHPESGLMPPLASRERGLVYQWSVFAPAEMEAPLFEAWTRAETDPERAASARRRFDKAAAVIDEALDGSQYLVGDQLTIADIMGAGTALLFTTRAGFFEELPQGLKDYVARLSERPAVQRTLKAAFA